MGEGRGIGRGEGRGNGGVLQEREGRESNG